MATDLDPLTQINIVVRKSLKYELDQCTEKRGLEKSFVIEEALSRYMHAADELPADIIMNTEIVLTDAGMCRFEQALAAPPKPTPALRMSRRDQKS